MCDVHTCHSHRSQLLLHSLSLESATAPNGRISIELGHMEQERLDENKKTPINIKEGVEYNVAISFTYVAHARSMKRD